MWMDKISCFLSPDIYCVAHMCMHVCLHAHVHKSVWVCACICAWVYSCETGPVQRYATKKYRIVWPLCMPVCVHLYVNFKCTNASECKNLEATQWFFAVETKDKSHAREMQVQRNYINKKEFTLYSIET